MCIDTVIISTFRAHQLHPYGVYGVDVTDMYVISWTGFSGELVFNKYSNVMELSTRLVHMSGTNNSDIEAAREERTCVLHRACNMSA